MKRTLLMILATSLWSLAASGDAACQPATANFPGGIIAYVREGKEIRLVAPDGTNDRRLWAHPRPDLADTQGIHSLAWRRDGRVLGFSSGHEAVSSLFDADIYSIRPDGSGLRKVTNPPSRAEFARFPKGTVRVTVRNGAADFSLFIVYVAGAPEPQSATVPPGSSQALTFTGVADFGAVTQPAVAMNGPFRWFNPGLDVRAGAAAQAMTLNLLGPGTRDLGAFSVVWRGDGTRVGYHMGRLWGFPAEAPAGSDAYKPLMGGDDPPSVGAWDWGPTPALADQILYASGGAESSITGEYGIYRMTEGSTGRGVKLTDYSSPEADEVAGVNDLRWLPDGSGFLFAKESAWSRLQTDASGPMSVKKYAGTSIHRYDFAAKKVTLVKELEGKAVLGMDVSPDGQWVVLQFGQLMGERGLGMVAPQKVVIPELWVMRLDGTGLRLLVKNGRSPAWGLTPN